MLANFAGGGAAVAVLAREAGARLVVVDAGVIAPPAVDGVRSEVVDGVRGTGNIASRSGDDGPTSLSRCSNEGPSWRTSSPTTGSASSPSATWASGTRRPRARCAPRSSLPIPLQTCGPGTGLDEAGVAPQGGRGSEGARRERCSDGEKPIRSSTLASVGGLEIAFLTGVILGAASRRVPVLLDGFVTGAAALVACAPSRPTRSARWSRRPARRSPGMRSSSSASGSSRCWISGSGSGRGPAPPSRSRWFARRSRSLRTWRPSRRRASAVREALRSAAAAVTFLTAVPIGRRTDIGARDLRRSLILFPAVGALDRRADGDRRLGCGDRAPSAPGGRARRGRRSARDRRHAPRRARRHRRRGGRGALGRGPLDGDARSSARGVRRRSRSRSTSS